MSTPPRFTRTTLGPYTLLRLGSDTTYIEVVPERSGYVHSLVLDGRSVLLGYPDADALTINKGHRNLSILPFPNRIRNGRYSWNKRDLQFEINDAELNAALHGFGAEVDFQVARVDLDRGFAVLHLSYLHRATADASSYPFDVSFELNLSVNTVEHSVDWQLSATNQGSESAPVGLCWHPYFDAHGQLDAWTVTMPPQQQVTLERGIPTGALTAGLPTTPVGIDTSWDSCFKLEDLSKREVQLHGPSYSLSLKQGGDTRYTQLFVPPAADSFAVEPMTCGVDAFNQTPQEVDLAAGESTSTSLSVQLIS